MNLSPHGREMFKGFIASYGNFLATHQGSPENLYILKRFADMIRSSRV